MPAPKRKQTPQERANLKRGTAAAKAARERAKLEPAVKTAEQNAADLLAGLRPGEPTRHQLMIVQALSRSMVITDRERLWLDRNPNAASEKAWSKMEQIIKLDAIQLGLHRELEAADVARVAAAEAAQIKDDQKHGRIKIGILQAVDPAAVAARRERAAEAFAQIIAQGSQEVHAETFARLLHMARQGALGPESRALALKYDRPESEGS